MQTLRLKRLLTTHYSLLVPYPPPPPSPPPSPTLPLAFVPAPTPEEDDDDCPLPLERTTTRGRPGKGASSWRRLGGRAQAKTDQAGGGGGGGGEGGGAAWPSSGGGAQAVPLDTIEELPPRAPPPSPDSEKPSTTSAASLSIRLVSFSSPLDPLNPHTWSTPRRSCLTALLALLCTWVGACSAMNASLWREAAADLGVENEVVMQLDTAAFLVGFGVAAPLWAPLSELAGRTPIHLVSLLLLSLSSLCAALSRSLASRIVLRFLAGCAATTPLSNAGAAMGDLWDEDERSVAFGVFGVGGFLGPCLGPVIGGWIAQAGWSYRWADGIQAIGAAVLFLVCFALLPETYPQRKREGDGWSLSRRLDGAERAT
ncbi:major facilitator superfamily domain-containing protein [Rhodotorula diobovata]|uniref:Major facilitator superfamily domain-containing protein n=1 Tax=Rhodotorula diobovata TaxID=5288 RepID=A0A5C5FV19_9BASI|nr:major facilitator superfamily domain-containing protein [Rhodotorula diobovata]